MFKETEAGLEAALEFEDFKTAFQFMTWVAELAEAHGHHPEWRNVYHRVWITLKTHDAGDQVTEKDHALAAAITGHEGIAGLKIREIH